MYTENEIVEYAVHSNKTRINNVRVNNRFISVEGDTNTHGGGSLKATLTVGKVRAGQRAVLEQDPKLVQMDLCPISPLWSHAQCASPM